MAPLNPYAPLYIQAAQLNLSEPPAPPRPFSPQIIHYYFNPTFSPITSCCPFPADLLFSPHRSYYISPHVPKLPLVLQSNTLEAKELEETKEMIIEVVKEEEEKKQASERFKCCKFKRPNTRKLKTFEDKYYEFREDEAVGSGALKTTVMIKNIPNKFNKRRVLDLLDNHCREVNKKIQADGDKTVAFSEFDFLYLPVDFRTGSNLGYAFVNFTAPLSALRLYRELHNKSWANFASPKICEVTYARIQGLPELLMHFKNSTFNCESEDYLPVCFTPSRDGSRRINEKLVGKHILKPRRA